MRHVAPDRFHDFFVAAAGVAGALTGLLFVAISVAPERLLGEDAAQAHLVRASAALTAFTNALVVSLFALLPRVDIGWPASVVALVGLLFVAGSFLSLLRVRRSQPGQLRDGAFLIGLAVVFGLQLRYGIRMARHPGDTGALEGVSVLVVVCFLIGISRSWELIGGPSVGLLNEVPKVLRDRGGRQGAAAGEEPDA
jgi:hypothetical protein